MFKKTLYRKSPIWLQELAISARALARISIRYDSRFSTSWAEIEQTQWLEPQQMRHYQLRCLLSVIRHAAENVPYYRQIFSQKRLRAEDFAQVEDIARLPHLLKQDVIVNQQSLVATNRRGLKIKTRTSGTTGTPVTVLQDMRAVIRHHVFIWRQLAWAGFEWGQRQAWIRGDLMVPAEQKQAPFWRVNRPENMLMMSSYHLSETNAPHYIRALTDFDPSLIRAYPSSIFYLARYLDNIGTNYKGRSLRSIVTESETLTEDQRATIENRMNCRVFDSYGSAERVVLITMCEKGSYHVNSDYGLLELIPSDGDDGCEVVGTGFNNLLMPLLRYRLGDVIVMENKHHTCSCGRHFPVVQRIYGRTDECIKTRDGRHITRLGHIFQGIKHVAEGQILQTGLDHIEILVVPFGTFSKKDEQYLLSKARDRLGKDIKITVKTVDHIVRTKNGKLRTVISNV